MVARNAPRTRSVWLPLLLASALTAVYSAMSLRRFARFDTPSWDNAIFEQVIKSYANLLPPISDIKGPGFLIFGDHVSPIVALIAPVYRVFPDARTLLIAQAVLIALSAGVIAHTAITRLGTRTGLAIALAYGLSFGIQSAVYTDFHEMAFAPLILALAGHAYLGRRWVATGVWLSLLLLVKEDLGVTVAVGGAVLIWCGARHVGGALILAGIAGFILAVFVIVPFASGTGFAYWSAVGFGSDGPGVLTNLFSGVPTKILTVLLTFGITGFLALRSPWVLLTLPTLGWRFIGEKPHYWGTGWHYSLILMPIVFIALIEALPMLRESRRRWLARYAAGAPAVVAAIAIGLCAVFPIKNLFNPHTWRPSPREGAAIEVMERIPAGSSVETNRGLVTHLVTDHTVYWPSTIGDVVPDYVLIDTQSDAVIAPAVEFARARHPDTTWEAVYEEDGYTLARAVR